MKKTINLYAIIVCSIIMLISCNQDISDIKDSSADLGIRSVMIESTELSNSLRSMTEDRLEVEIFKSKNNNVNFNFDQIQRVTRDGFDGKAYLLDQKGATEEAKNLYQLAFYTDDKEEKFKGVIINSDNTEENKLKITYMDMSGIVIQQILIDSGTETISFLYDGKIKGKPCGHEWADCINTMYTELGYGSVSWWVGTAIFGGSWLAGTIAGCGVSACIL